MKLTLQFVFALAVTLSAQELLPEIAPLAHKQTADTTALNEQKSAIIKRTQQPYVAALDTAEKTATAAGQLSVVAAINKERDVMTAGAIAPTFPNDLPKNLQSPRRSYVEALTRVTSDFAARQQRINADYLRGLASLPSTANPALAAQIATEKQRLLDTKSLMLNGDFSQKDASGGPASWLVRGQTSSIESDGGNSFLRLTKGYGNQWAAAPANAKEATLSARVRCPDFAKTPGKSDDFYQIYILMRMPDGKEKNLGGLQVHAAERNWKKIAVTGTIPPGATDIAAAFQIKSLGTLDIDDIKLEAK